MNTETNLYCKTFLLDILWVLYLHNDDSILLSLVSQTFYCISTHVIKMVFFAVVSKNQKDKRLWSDTPFLYKVRYFARDCGLKLCSNAFGYIWRTTFIFIKIRTSFLNYFPFSKRFNFHSIYFIGKPRIIIVTKTYIFRGKKSDSKST